jgi:hypothetical protein
MTQGVRAGDHHRYEAKQVGATATEKAEQVAYRRQRQRSRDSVLRRSDHVVRHRPAMTNNHRNAA